MKGNTAEKAKLKEERMKHKLLIGRICEYLVKEIIEHKTGFDVSNANDVVVNHPVSDLFVTNPGSGEKYEVSVKAKTGGDWPSVKGIQHSRQYIVFIDINPNSDPEFYVLSYRQWNSALKRMLQSRGSGAKIVDGAIEWTWMENGKQKKRRGSLVRKTEIDRYKNNWSILPGVLVT